MFRAAMLSLLLALSPAALAAPPAARAAVPAPTRTVTLAVQNMTCPLCPITIRKALERVPGVVRARVSFENKTATVTFDPTRTSVQALTKATTDAGYPSRLKPR